MITHKQSSNTLIRCAKYTLAVIGLWTIWCLLMVIWPQIFAHSTIRAIARVSIVLIPAVLFYLMGNREKTMIDYFLLRENWRRGVIIGCGVAALYFSIDWAVNFAARYHSFHFPVGFAIWLNFIIGSPLAEEVFFRGVLLQELTTIMKAPWAILISASAFAMLHVPQWLILDSRFGVELLSSFMTIFFYGVIFAVLVHRTRSLWASLCPHWINNFILLAIN